MSALQFATRFARWLLPALRRDVDAPFSWAYTLFAGVLTLLVAQRFYSEMQLQVFYTDVHRGAQHGATPWSAPLDDVFIHFDFARSAARGFPFHWLPENGYSSGGTSLLYPLLLALGYLGGAKGTTLMLWAATLACLCVLVTLLWQRNMLQLLGLPGWTAYALPPALLGVGVVTWSLWSGMEVALLLCVASFALLSWLRLSRQSEVSPISALPLGLANAALVATRPEAVCWVAVLAVYSLPYLGRLPRLKALAALAVIGLPAALVVILHALANRIFTGDWSAAGALVKLELNHPYLNRQQIIDWWHYFNEYQLDRITEHHLALPFAWGSWQIEVPGWILYWIAAVPFLFASTRKLAGLLWCAALSWVLLVALNGQVRWQNARYTVPALALILFAAGLGIAVVARWVTTAKLPLFLRAPAALIMAGALAILALGQLPLYRDQVWFFARASRNIYEQHVTTALTLRALTPKPSLVLLGDAGAIPYFSNLPALDIIGLGGYHQLPFARASRLGVGAILELIGRMPAAERPDTFALYPGWWGDLPSWFGDKRFAVPVRGNVICGGAAKVVYQANWKALEGSDAPFSNTSGELIDRVDMADVRSEREHEQRLAGAAGFVMMKLLPNPAHPERELWDAGRTLPTGATLHLRVRGLQRGHASKLVVRTTATPRSVLKLALHGAPQPALDLGAHDGWREDVFDLPAGDVSEQLELSIRAARGEIVVHHLWVFQDGSKTR